MDILRDRNFDDLANRFESRIYSGLKGRVRLAVIGSEIDYALECINQPHINVLDIGCGLGQHAARLAQQGHSVVANDVSENLLNTAMNRASLLAMKHPIDFQQRPYQELSIEPASQDLILSHALLEWLAQPELLFEAISKWLKPGGLVSLSFYNPAAKEYRNLIRGNFDWLQRQSNYRSDSGSLTPNNPCTYEQVTGWSESVGLEVVRSSGIRVFSDYIVEKRGGLTDEDSVFEMEIRYADREPFKWLGRYIHVLLKRHQTE